MLYETVCGHCPVPGGCRYRVGGVGVAEIAHWAVYRRDAGALLRLYPHLGVEQVRRAVERYILCPGHDGKEPPEPCRRALRAVA